MLGFIAALAFFVSLASALLNKGISGRSAEPSRFVRLSVSLLITSNIALAGVGGAPLAGEAERGVGLAIRGPDEGGGLGLRKLTTYPVSGLSELSDISRFVGYATNFFRAAVAALWTHRVELVREVRSSEERRTRAEKANLLNGCGRSIPSSAAVSNA